MPTATDLVNALLTELGQRQGDSDLIADLWSAFVPVQQDLEDEPELWHFMEGWRCFACDEKGQASLGDDFLELTQDPSGKTSPVWAEDEIYEIGSIPSRSNFSEGQWIPLNSMPFEYPLAFHTAVPTAERPRNFMLTTADASFSTPAAPHASAWTLRVNPIPSAGMGWNLAVRAIWRQLVPSAGVVETNAWLHNAWTLYKARMGLYASLHIVRNQNKVQQYLAESKAAHGRLIHRNAARMIVERPAGEWD